MQKPETPANSVRLTFEEFDRVISALATNCIIMAPRRFAGRGRFSDTDMIRYGEVRSAGDIEHRVKSDFSPKEILFPPVQTLLAFNSQQPCEPAEGDRVIYVFLRACDINGIDRLDDIFLRNGPEADAYYRKRRERVRFILMECSRSLSNCFCVSMGANRTDNYAVAVRWEDEGVQFLVRDEKLADLLPPTARSSNYVPAFVVEDDAPAQVPDLQKLTAGVRERDLFNHEMWKDYAERCIACGRCNTHCITCSCFSTFDLTDKENPQQAQRRRVWASCHIDRFTDMAGGHSFRQDYGSRMRFRTMHKIYDYRQRFGRNMCVGCGRCDDHCPEYISFSMCINRVNKVANEND